MKKLIINIAIMCGKIVNLPFKPLRLKKKVSIISRQSNEPTLDINMLGDCLISNGINTVVLTKKLNKSIGGMISYCLHLFSQMYHIATSKVVVLDGYCILVSILPKKKGQKVIQMWHALGAVKKFGWQNVESPDGHSREVAEAMKMHNNYDYILAPGEITGRIFAEAFHASEDKIIYYGLPRIDFLRTKDDSVHSEIFARYPVVLERANVLYVPTFRKNSNISIEKLIEGFDFTNLNLIIKKHFLDKSDYSWAKKAGAIVDEDFSTMQWLRICEKVVTDYSAVAFEAAILDKELYIYQPDVGNYKDKVGLNIDLREEAISDYVCETEDMLVDRLSRMYDKSAVIGFKNKFIEIDLSNCTMQLCEFIKAILYK